MDHQTVLKLNQLNTLFYQTTAESFDESRQQPWEGWHTLLENSQVKKCKSVVDIGCGNGRFAKYVSQHQFDYYFGLDNNPILLKRAQLYAENFNAYKLKVLDIITTLIDESMASEIVSGIRDLDFDPPFLFCLFGVMHHIPSTDLRQNILNQISTTMSNNDLLAVSCWQFDKIPNLMSRKVAAEKVELKESDLEKNDFILDWQRGKQAYRYCHLVTQQEMELLAEQANLEVLHQWQSDGKSHQLNNYYLLGKKGYNQRI